QAPLELPPAQPPRDPVWSGWDVAIIAAMLFVSFFIFLGIIAVFTRVSLSQGQTPQLLRVMLSAQFLSYAVVLICMRVIVRCYQRRFADAVHWHWPREYRWIAYLLGGMALAVLVQFLSSLLPIPKALPIDRYFQNRSSAYIMSIFGISM